MAAVGALSASQVAGSFLSQYEALWRQADSSGSGSVSAADAVALLKRSNLPDAALHTIWSISDYHQRGSLDKQGFFVALRLVAACQAGMQASVAVLTMTATAPPKFDGGIALSLSASTTTVSATSASTGSYISPVDMKKYEGIYQSLKPTDGRLAGDAVKPVLMNSKLPVTVLGQIWELADSNHDGFLPFEDFCVCMHLTYRALDGDPVPNVIPAQLRNQLSQASRQRSSSFTSSLLSPTSTLPPPSSPTSTTSQWVVSKEDQQQYEAMFRKLDVEGKQYVTGENCKPLFMATGVPGNVLAHIWSLCDMNSNGNLTMEQFSLAMHLAKQKKMSNIEPPQVLPADFIPPSMRGGNAGSSDDTSLKELTSQNEELSTLATEIEQLNREKDQCTEEVTKKQGMLDAWRGEVHSLQLEVNQSQLMLKSLEKQKEDMAGQLQSNEQELAQCETELTSLKEQIHNEESQIATLKVQLSSQQTSMQSQQDEIRQARGEVARLLTEEEDLKSSISKGRSSLNDLELDLQAAKSESAQVRSRIDTISQNQKTASPPMTLHTSTSQFGVAGVSPSASLTSAADPFQAPSRVDSDPFKSSAVADPFTKSDPFSASASDPFKSATDGGSVDPFAASAASFSNIADPFGSSNGSSKMDHAAGASDPFGSSTSTSQAGSSHLFSSGGGDLFSLGRSSSKTEASSFTLGSGAANVDPFASTDGSKSQKATSIGPDPFGELDKPASVTSATFPSSDPFSSSANSSATTAGGGGFGFFSATSSGSSVKPAETINTATSTSAFGSFDTLTGGGFGGMSDGFGTGADAFGSSSKPAAASATSTPAAAATISPSNTSDPFAAFGGSDPFSSGAKSTAAPAAASSSNLFSSDPFGAGGF